MSDLMIIQQHYNQHFRINQTYSFSWKSVPEKLLNLMFLIFLLIFILICVLFILKNLFWAKLVIFGVLWFMV